MRIAIITISSLLSVAAAIPYIIEVLKGRAKPRIVSWFAWSLILIVGAMASYSEHQIPATIYTLFCALGCLSITVLGFKNGQLHLEKLDIVSMSGVGLGLVALLFLKNPNIAVTLLIITDFIGTVPTIKHSWVNPEEEAWLAYLLYTVGSFFTLTIANFHVYIAVGFPLYLFIVDLTLVIIILKKPINVRVSTTLYPMLGLNRLAHENINSDNLYTGTKALVRIKNFELPYAPSMLNVIRANNTPLLTWVPVRNARIYNIYRNGIRIGESHIPEFNDPLESFNGYNYYVTAANGTGESGKSNTVSFISSR